MEGLTYLLAAVESLTFLPSKEAKCCSRASSRLLGACCDRKHTVSKYLRGGQWSWESTWRPQRTVVGGKDKDEEVSLKPRCGGWISQRLVTYWRVLVTYCWFKTTIALGETSVWDDVVHHSIFTNVNVAEPVAFQHSRGGHFTKDELRWFTAQPQCRQNRPQQVFLSPKLWPPRRRRSRWHAKGQHRSKSQTRRVKGEYLHKLWTDVER